MRIEVNDFTDNDLTGTTGFRTLLVGIQQADVVIVQKIFFGPLIAAEFQALCASKLAETSPDIIVAPLWAHGFDIIDVAAVLKSLRYRGLLCALTDRLPNSAAVLTELRTSCKGIDIKLLVRPE